MSLYQLTPQATEDLFEIWTFIAADSPEAADTVEEDFYATFSFLSANPGAGRVRADITALPVRFWTLPRFSNYLVVYDPVAKPLRILRVLHGARNLPRQFER